MKYQLVTLIFTLFLLSTESFFSREYFETIKLTKGGDAGCAACTIVISIIEQMAEIHHKEVEQVLDEICKLFPTGVDATCQFYVDNYGDLIIHYFNMGFSPDAVCHAIKICTNPKCRIDGDTEEIDLMEIQRVNEAFGIKIEDAKARFDPWDWIQKIINLIADHYPVVDFDGDRFSTLPGLRGVNWRGRDCNDGDATIYPGRKASRYDSSVDHNCNGIKGSTNGKSYEDLYCTGTGQMGVAVIGDSAGAHFSIPPEYMSPKDINGRTYSDILSVLSNEFDWPHKSAYTAFVNGTKDSPVSSVYQYMKQRNLCNHRDYQNLAVNGARSGAVNNELVNTLRRDKNNDHPILLFIELIGNDVCSPHPNFDHMTTVDEFRKNILGILNTLTNVLPNGSHVVFIGLVDGRVLWDNLYNRTHPMGYTYRQVYDYLNCLGINPCWVWMNSNETVRNIGTQRAMDLNTVYPEIVKNQNYPNFDVTYYPFPFIQIATEWVSQGGEIWQLIEPIDGFHPSQVATALMGDFLFKQLLKDKPQWFGKVNPNNEDIRKTFGDQGGY